MAKLNDFLSDPEVKDLIKQAQGLSKAMFKTKDVNNWERLNGMLGKLLNQLAAKTGMGFGDIHQQLYDVKASFKAAVPGNKKRRVKAYGDGPEDEDITISPTGSLGSQYNVSVVNGKHIGVFGEMDDAVAAVLKYMNKNKFFPNVWYIDDHGGVSLMNIKSAKKYSWSSFKAAVPGNLGNNTKPSTKQSQKQTVEMLKQGGILPPEEKAVDYPLLTASVKKEIIATLLKRKQPKLATWAAKNLVTSKARRVQAAKNYAEVVFLQRDFDFDDFNGSGGTGQNGFFDSDEKEMIEYLKQWDYGDNYGDVVDPMQQKGSRDRVYKKGQYLMTYDSGLGHAGLYVKA